MSDVKTPAAPAKTENLSITRSDLNDIIKSVANEMLAVSVATANAMRPQAAEPVMQDPTRGMGPLCSTCGQPIKACDEKHVEMAVYPCSYPEFGDFFQGVIVNGVKYLSNNESHLIPVPAKAAVQFQEIIRRYEANERESRIGRSKQHNSGHIANPSMAQSAWR